MSSVRKHGYVVYPFLLLPLFSVLFFLACKNDDPAPKMVVTDFTPTIGTVGTPVIIAGENFSTTAADNVVMFNGSIAGITEATETSLMVIVPAGATTGKITVTVKDKTATSASDFTVPAPTVTSFTPGLGGTGLTVTITGTNFSTVASENMVKFNGTAATVTEATASQLKVTVPAGASTGKIAVKVGTATATSADDFQYCSGPELVISNVTYCCVTTPSYTAFNYTYDLTNVGSEPVDLSKTICQTYVSASNNSSDHSNASGGYVIDSQGSTLTTGQTYHGSNSSSFTGTLANYPYHIIVISNSSITECNTANNISVKKVE